MKKPFAALALALMLCLSACSSQLAEPKNTPAPTAPEAAATPEPAPTPAPTPTLPPVPVQTQTEPAVPQAGPVEATVNVCYHYNRLLDTDGNWVNSGHVFYSICGNCGEMGSWFDNECLHCGAVYTDRVISESFCTRICDPNDPSIIYSESDEPFIVK